MLRPKFDNLEQLMSDTFAILSRGVLIIQRGGAHTQRYATADIDFITAKKIDIFRLNTRYNYGWGLVMRALITA